MDDRRIELEYTGIAATPPYINFLLLAEPMNLVIQSDLPVSATHLDHLARLAQSTDREQIAGHAWRLTDAQAHDGIAPYCIANRLDYGFVPHGRRLADFGLLVMDMDSTLISIECIDEIADMQGLKPQVATITEAAMRGEIDFAESLRRRVALLEGLDEAALQRVYDERLQLNPGAEAMLAKLKAAGIRTLLVSGGFVFFTERLKARLGLDYTRANTLEIANGKLTGRVLRQGLRCAGQGRLAGPDPRRTEAAARAGHCDGRRRERPEDVGAGRDQRRLPRQAGGKGTGQLCAEFRRTGRIGELAGKTRVSGTGPHHFGA